MFKFIKRFIINWILPLIPPLNYLYLIREEIHSNEKARITDYFKLLFELSSEAKTEINIKKREQELIVTLTTIPSRIHIVHIVIESLFHQSLKPDRIILNISKNTFSRQNLPETIKKQELRGIEVNFVDDIGPYTKLIPTMLKYKNAIYVTADDDIIYPTEWLERLYSAHKKQPQLIHCHRGHLIKIKNDKLKKYNSWKWDINYSNKDEEGNHLIFPTGVGGVIYTTKHFSEELFDQSTFLNICPKADDIWLKTLSLKNNTKCKILPNKIIFDKFPYSTSMFVINGTQEISLLTKNVKNKYNDIQIAKAFDHYGILSILKKME